MYACMHGLGLGLGLLHAWMHVCMYVCMYVCRYVRMYVRTYACMYVCMYVSCICNTFTHQIIKGSFCGLNVMYHNHSSPGVLQLPWCANTSQWNVVQLPSGMHIIMLQLPLLCYNDTRIPMQTS